MRTPGDQLLLQLKTHGPASSRSLAERLGVSRQAARQQLERLAADGLVEHRSERMGVGRPRQLWSLTAAGHGRFPDSHAQMTVEMIQAIQAAFGPGGLERVIAHREQAMEDAYGRAVEPAASLESRLARLAEIRAREGYMAEWQACGDGAFLLIENHCPICAAAAACQGFCRSELALFERLLAPAQVERIDHILQGARRCAYLVTPLTEGS